MKNSIKREQSDARIGFAERKNFRPQVKTKILSILALLSIGATGAWAQTALMPNGNNTEWATAMPAYDIEMSAEYYDDLLEDADNSTWLTANNGQTADVWLGRTLQPGSYNTLALPFTMSLADFKAAIGDDGVQVKELKRGGSGDMESGAMGRRGGWFDDGE